MIISNTQIEIAKGLFFWCMLGLALLCATVAAIVLLAATPFVVRWWSGVDAEVESIGTFGDQFGMTNALFSGLALAFVGITLLLQTLELRAQRKENDDTQAIMDQQQYQLKLQADAMKQQGFDYSFFQLEDAFRAIRSRPISRTGQYLPELLSNLSAGVNEYSSHCRQSFYLGHPVARNPYVKDAKRIEDLLVKHGAKPSLKEADGSIYDDKTMRACAYAAYVNRRKDISEWMGPYFQVLETTLDLIDTLYVFLWKPMESIDTPENDIMKRDYAKAKKYAGILFSSINHTERKFIAMYLDDPASENLRRQCRTYGLFENYIPRNVTDRYILSDHFKNDELCVLSGHLS